MDNPSDPTQPKKREIRGLPTKKWRQLASVQDVPGIQAVLQEGDVLSSSEVLERMSRFDWHEQQEGDDAAGTSTEGSSRKRRRSPDDTGRNETDNQEEGPLEKRMREGQIGSDWEVGNILFEDIDSALAMRGEGIDEGVEAFLRNIANEEGQELIETWRELEESKECRKVMRQVIRNMRERRKAEREFSEDQPGTSEPGPSRQS